MWPSSLGGSSGLNKTKSIDQYKPIFRTCCLFCKTMSLWLFKQETLHQDSCQHHCQCHHHLWEGHRAWTKRLDLCTPMLRMSFKKSYVNIFTMFKQETLHRDSVHQLHRQCDHHRWEGHRAWTKPKVLINTNQYLERAVFSAKLCHYGCSNKKLCIRTLVSTTANVTIIFGRVTGPERNILIFARQCYECLSKKAMSLYSLCSNKKLCITTLFISSTANVTIFFGRVIGPYETSWSLHANVKNVLFFSAKLCQFGCWKNKTHCISSITITSTTATVTTIRPQRGM